jgi:hypothetical protein
MEKVEEFEQLARTLIGDGKSPNIFFVSEQGCVFLVTTNFEAAYMAWRKVDYHKESALEDRKTGVIASREPEEDGSKRLITIDDSYLFKYHE